MEKREIVKVDTEKVRGFIKNEAHQAISLKDKELEFHGLEREFIIHQNEIMSQYEKTRVIKHPRDVGDARENILRDFLLKSGFMPQEYGVSQNRVRVASSSGHVSPEMDIVLFDQPHLMKLMNRNDVYEIYPIESVYGTIQVKSRFNKKEIIAGLDNIRLFKKLKKIQQKSINRKKTELLPFGFIFAYASDLEWGDIVNCVKNFSIDIPKNEWCNAIVVLGKGMIFHGESEDGSFKGYYKNSEINKITNLHVFSLPDQIGNGLYSFFGILLHLLEITHTFRPSIDSYYRLPFASKEFSYSYGKGAHDEIAHCEKHGSFLKKIKYESLKKVFEYCLNVEAMNWIKTWDIAYGRDGNNEEAYKRQPGDVKVYNPECYPLKDVLTMTQNFNGRDIDSLAYIDIIINGVSIWIPLYYIAIEEMFERCPGCVKKKESPKI